MTREPSQEHQRGLAGVAIEGTAWTAGQAIIGKVAALVATWVVAMHLSERDFAMAAIVVTATKVMCIFPPLNMGDALIAAGDGFRGLLPAARQVVFRWSLLIVLGIGAAAPILGMVYDAFPRGLFIALLAVSALRVLGEALQVPASVALRMEYRYQRIAVIDGAVQVAAALATITIAVLGGHAWAMVVPPVAAAFAKAALYRAAVEFPAGSASDAADRARLSRKFRLAGAAQYMHSLVDTAPLLIVARWSNSVEAGLFAFAFNLAAQANAVVGIKLAGVLQPILANLAHSGERQAMGFLRTLRVLGAVVVPVCLCQAVVAQPLFAAVFPERWQPAAAIFAVLSMCEALFFAAAPTMAMLKAQGRFRLFLTWQGVHFVALVAILPMVAPVWGALGVAVANMLLWAVSLPLVVALAVRPSGVSAGRALAVFLVPWLGCAPFALAAWAGIDRLQSWGTTGTWLSLLVVGPAAFAAMMLSLRWYQPETYHELSSIAGRVLSRVRRLRG